MKEVISDYKSTYDKLIRLSVFAILVVGLPGIGYRLGILLPMKVGQPYAFMSIIWALMPQIAAYIVVNSAAVRLTRRRFLWLFSALIPFELILIYILFISIPYTC